MRLSFAFLALVASPALVALAAPAPAPTQNLALPTQLRMTMDSIFGTTDDDDICPDLVVRCIKDGDVTNIIGDIGEQKFCRGGKLCKQCHSSKNSAECNLKYLKDCAGKCEGVGSPI